MKHVLGMERTPNAARLIWLRALECVKHELRTRDQGLGIRD